MRTVLKFKWPIFIGLLILTTVLFFLAPDLTKQAENAGSLQLPSSADSQKAADLLEEAGVSEDTISLVIPLTKPIDDSIKKDISSVAKQIKDLGKMVTGVLDPFENKDMEAQLVSKDQMTVLVPITVDGTQDEIVALAEKIRSEILPKDQTIYLTGESIIENDVNVSAQEGLKKTEIITVVLIFVLLLIVFRSIVTPIIPLVAVGITYLLSQSLVSFFIDWFGFPVSNYTQIFLVAILFGLGTDYCILLLSRYKEELLAGHPVEEAVINTYKTAGRTLFISALAVFIGFTAIGFADFSIFKSAVAVAVGIAVLMIVLFTVVPLFMVLLKDKLFWPSKAAASHKDSKLWIAFSKVSVKRPLFSMLIVAVITVPLLLTYDNDLSFNMIDEIDQSKESVMGLNAISKAFGEGDSLPVQVILKKDSSMMNESDITYLELISQNLEKVDGVKAVRTLTRPTGEIIEDFYVDHQIRLMADGLSGASEGLDEVQGGLSQVQGGLDGLGSQLTSGAGVQPGGIQSQLGALAGGLQELSAGVEASNNGIGEINSGLEELSSMLKEMSESASVRDTGLFIPKGTLATSDFKPVLEQYAFDNGSGIFLEVILDKNPYSRDAIAVVQEIKDSIKRSVIDTPFENAEIAYSGISSTNSDLSTISSNDFTRTVMIMLVGLFVVLTVLFRSAIMPLYMLGSLLLTYYTSISITELIFVNGLGYNGISWAVPFFGFIMLIALGVDYSIFLLDRFREESINGLTVRDALMKSMAKMGTVIITAAIILAGTFGAMIPSGVLSLMQIASVVITGLLLYGLIILPLLIPAITVSFGKGVWWPFRK
ncbi:MMPL family transporter [Sporosarcina siberiensis]|uniref:MMPL family transporter n=1 Tax=Sporosarcina siberiensis TaxID=1365606 RepID=A0ABW4SJT8_9BACL